MITDETKCRFNIIGGHLFMACLLSLIFFIFASLATHKKTVVEIGEFNAVIESVEIKNNAVLEMKDENGNYFEIISKKTCVIPEKINSLIDAGKPVKVEYAIYNHSSFFNLRHLKEKVISTPVTACEEHA